jgi:hypothetical protein
MSRCRRRDPVFIPHGQFVVNDTQNKMLKLNRLQLRLGPLIMLRACLHGGEEADAPDREHGVEGVYTREKQLD